MRLLFRCFNSVLSRHTRWYVVLPKDSATPEVPFHLAARAYTAMCARFSAQANSKQYGDRSEDKSDTSMSHVWPDIIVRGVGGTIVVRTRQLIKDARAANVLVYNGKHLSRLSFVAFA